MARKKAFRNSMKENIKVKPAARSRMVRSFLPVTAKAMQNKPRIPKEMRPLRTPTPQRY